MIASKSLSADKLITVRVLLDCCIFFKIKKNVCRNYYIFRYTCAYISFFILIKNDENLPH